MWEKRYFCVLNVHSDIITSCKFLAWRALIWPILAHSTKLDFFLDLKLSRVKRNGLLLPPYELHPLKGCLVQHQDMQQPSPQHLIMR